LPPLRARDHRPFPPTSPMKIPFALALVLPLAVACRTSSPSNPPLPFEAAAATPEHAWLQQLVGDWKVRASATSGPDQPEMEFASTERVRSLGGLWVLAEGDADMAGTPLRSQMTIGYDPAQGQFVGTWIDSVQTHLWTYLGSLDETRTKLTLEAEGPAFHDPAATATYRDTIEIVDADHKRMISAMRNPDGTWTEYMRAEGVRVK
jgi:hypothetical protein